MTDFFYEYQVRERLRELEALDRRMERWGWFRKHEIVSAAPWWRFRAGEALIRRGCLLQGSEEVSGTFPRVLADRPRTPARFLVLGSASPAMLQQTSETLAGRIGYHELRGLSLEDVGSSHWTRLWVRGGFPRAFLARSAAASDAWRRDFVRTFLERDLPQLGIGVPSTTLHRFWTMLAHYHGQTWNASEFGRSFGVADTTVRNYLDLLTAALVIRTRRTGGKKETKRSLLVDGNGIPLSLIVSGAHRHDVVLLEPTLDRVVVRRPRTQPRQHLCADKGYTGQPADQAVRAAGTCPTSRREAHTPHPNAAPGTPARGGGSSSGPTRG